MPIEFIENILFLSKDKEMLYKKTLEIFVQQTLIILFILKNKISYKNYLTK